LLPTSYFKAKMHQILLQRTWSGGQKGETTLKGERDINTVGEKYCALDYSIHAYGDFTLFSSSMLTCYILEKFFGDLIIHDLL